MPTRDQGVELAIAAAKASGDSGAQAVMQSRKERLERYLSAQEPSIEGQKQSAKNEANLPFIQKMQEMAPDAAGVGAGDLKIGSDPMAKAYLMNDKGEENARQKAIANYNKSLPKLQATFQAAQEGITAANDPDNMGSLGQARTLMLKSMGMNRYNENEAKAVLPPALHAYAANIFNAAGGDTTPLNESQRAAVNQFFKTQLHMTKQQHDMLKQSSLDTYDSSRYAAPTGHQQLQNRLGGGFSKAIEDSDKQYQDIPATKGSQLNSQPMPGMLDKLKAYFGGGSAQPSQAPAPQGFNPDSFLKGQ